MDLITALLLAGADLLSHSLPTLAGFVGGFAGGYAFFRLRAWRARRRAEALGKRAVREEQ